MKIGSSTNMYANQTTNQMKKTQKEKDKAQEQLSSGKKVNSAADDAATLSISEKMLKQINALNQGSFNIQDGIGMNRIADGAMQSVSENILDLETQSVRAMNGTMSTDDKAIIQGQVNATLDTIDHVSKNTVYNEKNVLDGSTKKTDIYTGTDSEMISSSNMTIEALGLKDFSITGDNIDTTAIDQAASTVASERSKQGAQINGLEHVYQSNQITAENTTAAYSRKVDAEMEKSVMEYKKASVVNEAQNRVLKNKMDQNENMVTKMLA